MTTILSAFHKNHNFLLNYNQDQNIFEIQKDQKFLFETDIPLTAITQFLEITEATPNRTPSANATLEFLKNLKNLEQNPQEREGATAFYKTLHTLGLYKDFVFTKKDETLTYTFEGQTPQQTIILQITPTHLTIDGYRNRITFEKNTLNNEALKDNLKFLENKYFEALRTQLPYNEDAYPQKIEWFQKAQDYTKKFQEVYKKDKNIYDIHITFDEKTSKLYCLKVSYNPQSKKLETSQETLNFQKPDEFEPLRLKPERLKEDTYQKTETSENSVNEAKLQILSYIFQREGHTPEENYKIFQTHERHRPAYDLEKFCQNLGGVQKAFHLTKFITELKKQNIPDLQTHITKTEDGYLYQAFTPKDPDLLKIQITPKDMILSSSLRCALWAENTDFQNSYKHIQLSKTNPETLAHIIKKSVELETQTYPLLQHWQIALSQNSENTQDIAKTLREHIKKGRFFDIPKTKIMQISYCANKNPSKFERLTKTLIDVVQSTPKQKEYEDPML